MKIKKSNSSWVWLLTLFSLAGLVETIIYSQLTAFTPLYLPELGVPEEKIPFLVGLIAAISNGLGIPFLPFCKGSSLIKSLQYQNVHTYSYNYVSKRH